MPITFHPEPRMVLICDFSTGFREPEMVKIRPVVVLSHQRFNARTCVVVPLSSTEPELVEGFHHRLDPLSLPERLRSEGCWVKGDMITTVALTRLDRVRNGRDATGKRLYVSHKVTMMDWAAIQYAIAVALGLSKRLV